MFLDNTAKISDILTTLQGIEGLNQKADLVSQLTGRGRSVNTSMDMATIVSNAGKDSNCIAENIKSGEVIDGVIGKAVKDHTNPIWSTLLGGLYSNTGLIFPGSTKIYVFAGGVWKAYNKSNGSLAWTHTPPADCTGLTDLIELNDGNVIYTGTGNNLCHLVKLNSSGVQQWEKTVIGHLGASLGFTATNYYVSSADSSSSCYFEKYDYNDNHIYGTNIANGTGYQPSTYPRMIIDEANSLVFLYGGASSTGLSKINESTGALISQGSASNISGLWHINGVIYGIRNTGGTSPYCTFSLCTINKSTLAYSDITPFIFPHGNNLAYGMNIVYAKDTNMTIGFRYYLYVNSNVWTSGLYIYDIATQKYIASLGAQYAYAVWDGSDFYGLLDYTAVSGANARVTKL